MPMSPCAILPSNALATPKGEVLSCGGNTRRTDYQVFRPHYLDGNPTRPQWSTTLLPPNQITYNQLPFQFQYTMPFGQTLSKVVLTAPGAPCHVAASWRGRPCRCGSGQRRGLDPHPEVTYLPARYWRQSGVSHQRSERRRAG